MRSSSRARVDRARGRRRSQFCEEGRELGATADGHAQREVAGSLGCRARRLAASDSASARWVGKDALSDLKKADARKRKS
jgi:hypothetical protein